MQLVSFGKIFQKVPLSEDAPQNLISFLCAAVPLSFSVSCTGDGQIWAREGEEAETLALVGHFCDSFLCFLTTVVSAIRTLGDDLVDAQLLYGELSLDEFSGPSGRLHPGQVLSPIFSLLTLFLFSKPQQRCMVLIRCALPDAQQLP